MWRQTGKGVNMDTTLKEKGRIHWIDNVRAVAFINMILYHLMFDLVYIFGVNVKWYRGTPGYVWQQAICMTLIFVSGMSCNFSKNNLKRGLVIFVCGMLMTVGTWLFMPSQFIVFGILHFLGIARIIFAFGEKPLGKLNKMAGFAVAIALFALTKKLPSGYLGIWDKPLWELPDVLYQSKLLFWAGLPHATFSSGDYFPVLPWIFLYLAGYYFFGILKERGIEGKRFKDVPALSFIGKHTLLIYVFHQPVIYGVLTVLSMLGVFN